MGCMCKKCKHANDTEDQDLIVCDNWESEYYGQEMYREYDGCDEGEVDAKWED